MATEFIFTHPIIKVIATGLTGFTIGAVVTTGLHSFTGGTLLTNTQTEVSSYVENVQSNINGLSSYLQENNTTNAEVIKQYQQALEKANANLTELKGHITTSDNSLETELVALQERYNELQASVDAQVQAKVNEVIAEANIQIDAANTASTETYDNVHAKLGNGNIDKEVKTIKDANPALAVKDEDLQVESIADIVGIKLDSAEFLGQKSYFSVANGGLSTTINNAKLYKLSFNDGYTVFVALNENGEIKGLSTDGERYSLFTGMASSQQITFHETYEPLFNEYLANQQ